MVKEIIFERNTFAKHFHFPFFCVHRVSVGKNLYFDVTN